MLRMNRYEGEHPQAVRLVKAKGRASCPFCKSRNKIKKDENCIRLTVNGGPVGEVFICMEHASSLSEELLYYVQESD
jgi:hypothetical protein